MPKKCNLRSKYDFFFENLVKAQEIEIDSMFWIRSDEVTRSAEAFDLTFTLKILNLLKMNN